jgi:hypothetical protein
MYLVLVCLIPSWQKVSAKLVHKSVKISSVMQTTKLRLYCPNIHTVHRRKLFRMDNMALPVVEFSREGYKIRKVFG